MTTANDDDLLHLTGPHRRTLRLIIRQALGEGILSRFCFEALNQGEVKIYCPILEDFFGCKVFGILHRNGFQGIVIRFLWSPEVPDLPRVLLSSCMDTYPKPIIVQLQVIKTYDSENRLLLFPVKVYDNELCVAIASLPKINGSR